MASCDNEGSPVAPSILSEQEKADLSFLREEEKLARDVYMYAYDKYQQNIFLNIGLDSEQNHMAAVLTLLNKYGLPDPAEGKAAGEFQNRTLQQLNDDLTAISDSSLIHALTVGAIIEDLDINDIKTIASRTSKDDLLVVYDNLTCGSRNHLRSFVGQLNVLGAFTSPNTFHKRSLTALSALRMSNVAGNKSTSD